MSSRIAVLGGGRIGEALLGGLLAAGREPGDLVVAEKFPARAEELSGALGITAAPVADAVRGAATVVVAVKPQDVVGLLGEVAPVLEPGALVVSLCAGLPTSLFEGALPGGTPVVRVMPNTPMLLGAAMCAISAGAHAGDEHLAETEALLGTVGAVLRIDESKQDIATAVSGSGPAYFFLVAEAMIEAGVALGLTRPAATELTVQTALGAARMLRETGEHPAVLRENVTSPAGTTAAALRELERHGIRSAFADAVTAAHDRSVELGRS
ncbi:MULTISPECIES: pyrroline-5-carboxylate reductase [Pseudonocardia]|uniref:Pyrroline-5-carboxylate reductase n=2 Tax=Pseudonocardia TaxID=1847 RepID=A0A1Y2NB96_PSEAH|nr:MULTISPECIES: pyrroline-5-carboxylate reductase [Pseudonocardia]OSY44168.1 Pyrroline-5-carboxylate reductase [Pseudonocardia autotrophica]TDN74102.1 pyrroline-5-carboxylate reductase [Pseudonocardia autotrophica]BBG04860.1 pyrroline-5-carboxylate reductase [Pseudonocardia autotrophica]GEC23516.1 pyrroline-5-carboxylate reductase [Pseudonocardia saturnea]